MTHHSNELTTITACRPLETGGEIVPESGGAIISEQGGGFIGIGSLELGQCGRPSPRRGLRRSDRRRVGRTAPELPAAGDNVDLVGSGTKLLTQIIDQQVDAAVLADDPRQRVATDRLGRGKNHRLDAQHPFAPAHLRRQIRQLPIQEMFISSVRSPRALFVMRSFGSLWFRHRHNP
ncbi:hypothetical protein shn_31825 (plasmid) [Shinella sp. HZN7]|nr:hypothetical protein shn_31825 [Shinella sp. HZN7]